MIDQRHPEPEWHGRHWEDEAADYDAEERYLDIMEHERDRRAEEEAIDVQERHYRGHDTSCDN